MADGFAFRLQKVLDHRVRVEDIKKQTFAANRLAYLKEKENLDIMQGKLNEHVSNTAAKKSNIFNYVSHYNYMTLLEKWIEDQSIRVRLSEEEMNKKKLEFEESQKDRKVIDKIKENSFKEFKLNSDKLEQKHNDEFALYAYMRK